MDRPTGITLVALLYVITMVRLGAQL